MRELQTALDSTPNPLIQEFKDSEEYRYAYAEEHLNTTLALQIRVLRELRGMKQSDLARAIGTQQPGIARLENVNYSAWKTETLRKIARALGVRLKITFETFGTLLDEDDNFSRKALERPTFDEDEVFKESSEIIKDTAEHYRPRRRIAASTDEVEQGVLFPDINPKALPAKKEAESATGAAKLLTFNPSLNAKTRAAA